MAQLVGTRVAVQGAVQELALGDSVERLGPLPWVPVGRSAAAPAGVPGADHDHAPKIQLLLRVGLQDGPGLSAALSRMKAIRSARKEREPVSVRVDPMDGLG